MTYPTISELEKRIEQLERQLEKELQEQVYPCTNMLVEDRNFFYEALTRIEKHNQFLARRLEAQASRIAVLEGHPKNYEKTVEG